MNKERKKAETVEELENFPFKTFAEFKKATLEGVASVGVDRSVALNWSHSNGLYASGPVKFKTILFMLLPFAAALGLLTYIVIAGSWWLLLSLPIVAILYFMFHPSVGIIFGPIRTLFIVLTFAGVAYSIYASVPWMLALSLALVVIWYGQKSVYANAIAGLIEASSRHEDLFCKLWQSKAANVRFFNGDYYWVDHKKVGEQYVHYEE